MNAASIRRVLALFGCACGILAASAEAADTPNAVIVVEAPLETPGSDPKAALPRLVLLKDGQVFVGGTGRFDTARLERPAQQALRRAADALRKAAGRNVQLALGPDTTRSVVVRFPDDKVEIRVTGDPGAAPASLAPAGAALLQLLRFDDPALQPYKPASFVLSAREGQLAGGCRVWTFAVPVEQAATAPFVITAEEADGWPTGGWPASVCVGPKRYVVSLRPLLPGEQP
jgi:hypothetical protein